ncbi:hypothetical protein NQ317_002070 [Molorchus minor]|uniref:Fzo/mitofusin HR2 domain-containing protein n=1 Tax=Molorchus minor TaxID=1323400 RepID=A0ABQ9JJT8_9CUCU|nr:hypothetical protein NQ317_002070 [Molorchus minor]
MLDGIYNDALKLKEDKLKLRKDLTDKINYTEQQLMVITQEMKKKIHTMVEDVEQRVSKALNEEIRRLSTLVDEFSLPFHSEPLVLNVYKKELHLHVETGLGSNLRARLSTALALNMEASQKEMTERMETLIPDHHKAASNYILPRRQPFEILYRLNCDNLCADFHEDLEFRFSWGISSLIQRFAGSGSSFLALKNKRDSPQNSVLPSTPTDTVDSRLLYTNASLEDWSLLSRIAIMGATSQGTMGCLLVGGFLFKTVGWRIIVVTDLTSANCSHQVQQELSGTFARLCHLVDESTSEMDKQLRELEAEVSILENAGGRAKVFRNKANYLAHELELFEDAYLKIHH